MKYYLVLILIFLATIANSMSWDLTHKITNKNKYINNDSNNDFTFDLNYQPDFSSDLWSMDSKRIDLQLVLNQTNSLNYLDSNWEGNIDLGLYRSLVRYSTLNYEYRLGLQQLNFGQARILRPLQWFDNIDPLQENSDSDGVYAFLAKRYFLDNSNMWGWIILDDNEFSDDYSPDSFIKQMEYGGRWQYSINNSETAISLHHKRIYNNDFKHKTKLGFDIRKDMLLGFWSETSWSLIYGKGGNFFSNNWTLGADYTFSLGNGIYVLTENLFISEIDDDGYFPNKVKSTAFQIEYPLNMFDSVQSIITYDWQFEQHSLFFSYVRSYDYLSLYLNLYQTGEGDDYYIYSPVEESSAIELVLETKF